MLTLITAVADRLCVAPDASGRPAYPVRPGEIHRVELGAFTRRRVLAGDCYYVDEHGKPSRVPLDAGKLPTERFVASRLDVPAVPALTLAEAFPPPPAPAKGAKGGAP